MSPRQKRVLLTLSKFDGWLLEVKNYHKSTIASLERRGLIVIRDGIATVTETGRNELERAEAA